MPYPSMLGAFRLVSGMIGRTSGALPRVDPLLELSATELVEAFRAGDVTASSYAKLALRRAETLDSLNIFITLFGGQSRSWPSVSL